MFRRLPNTLALGLKWSLGRRSYGLVKTRLLPLLLVNFIGTIGFSLVLPFLVFLVTDWGGNAFVYGLAGATYSSFQLVGAPILGRWSDRYGRRNILLLSQAGTLVSWLVFLVAFALPRVELLRFDSAASGGFVVTPTASCPFRGAGAGWIDGWQCVGCQCLRGRPHE